MQKNPCAYIVHHFYVSLWKHFNHQHLPALHCFTMESMKMDLWRPETLKKNQTSVMDMEIKQHCFCPALQQVSPPPPGVKKKNKWEKLLLWLRDARGSLALKASWKEQPVQALHSLGPLNNSDVVEPRISSPQMIYFCVLGHSCFWKAPHSPDTSAAAAQFIMSGASHITGRTSQQDKQEGTLRVASFGGNQDWGSGRQSTQ